MFYLVAMALKSFIQKLASLVISLTEIMGGGMAISNSLIGRYLKPLNKTNLLLSKTTDLL